MKQLIKHTYPFLFSLFFVAGLIFFTSFSAKFNTDTENSKNTKQFLFHSDTLDFTYFQVKNPDGFPLYYFRDIDQFPCDDSVCARMQLRMYWDLWGNFLKLDFTDGQELTKIGHVPFSEKDYKRLHLLLNNPRSGIQYYKLADLTAKESENEYYSLDAISGATVSNVIYESVRGAVKTCHTLWQIANGPICDLIKSKTTDFFSENNLSEKINTNQQLVVLSQKIINKNFTHTEFLLSAFCENRSSINTFCLLELARQTPDINNDFFKQLSATIKNSQTIEEIAVYNFLLQKKYKNKTIRRYQPFKN